MQLSLASVKIEKYNVYEQCRLTQVSTNTVSSDPILSHTKYGRRKITNVNWIIACAFSSKNGTYAIRKDTYELARMMLQSLSKYNTNQKISAQFKPQALDYVRRSIMYMYEKAAFC